MQEKSLMQLAIKENIIKNVIIVILVFLFYPIIKHALQDINIDMFSNILTIFSILLVTVSFANFAFSYEYVVMEKRRMRMLAHHSTFIFMLLIALLLESLAVSMNVVYPSLSGIIVIFSILLYIGVALYDFWDFFRAFNKK